MACAGGTGSVAAMAGLPWGWPESWICTGPRLTFDSSIWARASPCGRIGSACLESLQECNPSSTRRRARSTRWKDAPGEMSSRSCSGRTSSRKWQNQRRPRTGGARRHAPPLPAHPAGCTLGDHAGGRPTSGSTPSVQHRPKHTARCSPATPFSTHVAAAQNWRIWPFALGQSIDWPAAPSRRSVADGCVATPGSPVALCDGRRSFVLAWMWPSASTARFRADHYRSPRMTEV